MIVYCASFGSNWFRQNHSSGSCAWFNTTGIRRNWTSSRVRRRWTFQGSVRFNADHFKWVSTPRDLIGQRCFSPGIEKVENDETRLLCSYPVKKTQRIDAYLVCVKSDEIGFIDRKEEWKSQTARLISASSGKGGPQEFLMLVQNQSWIRTSQGLWQWQITLSAKGKPCVELAPIEEEV